MRTLQMTLSYDGTHYCGWQLQPNGVSVQEIVERALSQFVHQPVRVIASGRTDAGVHAIGQVVSFETSSSTPCHGFVHGLPRYLPDDVVVHRVEEASPGFNARFDAVRKSYRYVIHNHPTRLPFLRSYALWQRNHLNEQSMNEAAEILLGTHDFRCFETNWPNRSSSVRTVSHARVIRTGGWPIWDLGQAFRESHNEGENFEPSDRRSPMIAQHSDAITPFVCFDIEADGFLYNMVRAIVGTLIHIGRNRWAANDMRRIIESGRRSEAGETAPPQGLYLMQVDYDIKKTEDHSEPSRDPAKTR